MEQHAFGGRPGPIEVRPMTREDIPQVARLYAELIVELRIETNDPYLDFEAFPLLEMELSLEEDLHSPEACAFVAEEESTLVGLAVGHLVPCFLPFSRVGRVGQISAAYVPPSHRGRRVMAELERRLQGFFHEAGLRFVELHVLSANEIGKATWRALGYTTFREQMRKQL